VEESVRRLSEQRAAAPAGQGMCASEIDALLKT
jgi:hypothetical protein